MPTIGWIPEKYDPNDKPYRSGLKGKINPKSIDLSVGHPEWFKEIYDQGSSNSCVANATAGAYRFLARKLNEGTTGKLQYDPSRLFIYYNARLLPQLEDKTPPISITDVQQLPQLGDDGSENRDAFKGLNLFGACTEQKWPFKILDDQHVDNINTVPPNDAYEEAKEKHAITYCRLDLDHPEEVEEELSLEEKKAVGIVTLVQLKQCLTEGYPVVFGFWYYWDEPPWETNDPTGYVLPELPIESQHTGPPEGSKFGGHTVLAIGYDESRKQVLCQNSWGATWSNGGKFWMPYSWITDWEATDDFWMVRLMGA